jgi:predicted AAA+ superfamily ATPase
MTHDHEHNHNHEHHEHDHHGHNHHDHEHHDHDHAIYTVDGVTPAVVSVFRDIDAQSAEELSAKYRPIISELTDTIKNHGWTIGHIKLQTETSGGTNFFISATSPDSVSELATEKVKVKLGLTVIAIGPSEEELKKIVESVI